MVFSAHALRTHLKRTIESLIGTALILFAVSSAAFLPLGTPSAEAAFPPGTSAVSGLVIQISGSFGLGRLRIGSFGTGSPSSKSATSESASHSFYSEDANALLARDTGDRFVLPAIAASAGLTTAVTSELVQAAREKRPVDFQSLYRKAILATASGFALGTLAAPGLTNHFIAKAVVDASLRYIVKRSLLGRASRDSAGNFQTDVVIGALRGLIQSQLPMEVLTWLPCHEQNLSSDVCNGLHALVMSSLIQGSEEVGSQLLSRTILPENPRNSMDLMASFLRGSAFGAVEQALTEIVLGAPQWMSPEDRRIVSDIFRRSGLSDSAAECFEKNTLLYGGLWFAATRGKNMNFSLGSTTMVDREFYFLDDLSAQTVSTHAHEVGGHCSQWLNLGLVNFLARYLSTYFQVGEHPTEQGESEIEDGVHTCTGNAFECEAQGLSALVVRVMADEE